MNNTKNFTVIGGNGFIGSQVCKDILNAGHELFVPDRDDPKVFTRDLGIVVYCAGFGDCIKNPHKVLESNTSYLSQILKEASFDRLVYLSSTRVYMGQGSSSESDDVKIIFSDNRKLFNLTKLVAEEMCLLSDKDVVIVRPSNVYGLALDSILYLPTITRHAISNKLVNMFVTPNYEKDYVSVNYVSSAVLALALKDTLKQRIFNVASGENVRASEIADMLVEHTNCKIVWHDVDETKEDKFPITDISAVKNEIDIKQYSIYKDLPDLINKFKLAM